MHFSISLLAVITFLIVLEGECFITVYFWILSVSYFISCSPVIGYCAICRLSSVFSFIDYGCLLMFYEISSRSIFFHFVSIIFSAYAIQGVALIIYFVFCKALLCCNYHHVNWS